MMDNDLFQKLFVRYMAGEKVTSLAKEAEIPWQRLWGMLQGHRQNQAKSKKDEGQPKTRQDATIRNAGAVVRDSDGIDRITFDSIGQSVVDAMADYAQNEGNRQMIAQNLSSHMSGRDKWANCYTRKKLLDAIENPPKHLMDAVDQMRQSLMDEVNPPVASRRRIRRNQEWGDELEAEKVLTRSFTPWDRMTRETQPRRSVTIGVNLTVHCGQRAEDLLWRGAAAAALADILTQRGVNVEIVAFWTIGHMSSMSSMVVSRYIIKRADMPLDLGSVAMAFAEIAYARLVALYGLARHVPGKLDESLGHCERLPAQDRSGIDYLAESNITNRTAAENWLKASASRQEGEVLHV